MLRDKSVVEIWLERKNIQQLYIDILFIIMQKICPTFDQISNKSKAFCLHLIMCIVNL